MKEFLARNAIVCDSDIPDDSGKVYLSKKDRSYITRVGMEGENKIIKFYIPNNSVIFSRIILAEWR